MSEGRYVVWLSSVAAGGHESCIHSGTSDSLPQQKQIKLSYTMGVEC